MKIFTILIRNFSELIISKSKSTKKNNNKEKNEQKKEYNKKVQIAELLKLLIMRSEVISQ